VAAALPSIWAEGSDNGLPVSGGQNQPGVAKLLQEASTIMMSGTTRKQILI
jgi:hypothetical protein